MSELQLIKQAKFGEIQADIYSKDNEPYMTAEQLGTCLGYSHPRENINKLVSRNKYLREKGFSAEVKMTSLEGIVRIPEFSLKMVFTKSQCLPRRKKQKSFVLGFVRF